MRRILFVVLLAIVGLTCACSEDKKGVEEFVLEPSGPEAEAAIRRVLEADRFLGGHYRDSMANKSFWEKDETRVPLCRTLATNMRKIPMDGVPSEFRQAYLAHASAWEVYDSVAISTTWLDVVAAAQRHGVTWKE